MTQQWGEVSGAWSSQGRISRSNSHSNLTTSDLPQGMPYSSAGGCGRISRRSSRRDLTAQGLPANNTSLHYSLGHPPIPAQQTWQSGLCHCFNDPANCIITAFCPCITFGRIAEIITRGEKGCGTSAGVYCLLMGFCCLACLSSSDYRSEMRKQYNLEEGPCDDCLVHVCCETCALCQEYRQLKAMGFDMSIGWEGNQERGNRGIAMAAPAPPQGMLR